MTSMHDTSKLSIHEFLVLARLAPQSTKGNKSGANPKPIEEKALAKILVSMGCAETEARARQDLAHITSALRVRGLVEPLLPKTKRSKVTRWQLTDAGARWLRDALGLARTPSWLDLQNNHFGSLALGLEPGSEPSRKVMKDKSTLLSAILGTAVGVAPPCTLVELCDALLRKRLGITTKSLTLGGIRAQLLVEYLREAGFNIDSKGVSSNLATLATKLGADIFKLAKVNKDTLDRALTRHWLYHVRRVDRAYSPLASAQKLLNASVPSAMEYISTPVDPDAQLLAAVKGAIPQIGSDGRYGPEKVFVSALWNQLERDGHGGLLPFDRFKQWLVMANRNRLLDLARADMVVTMDPRLVAASEIRDLGSTFHFVLDHQIQLSGAARRQPGRA